MEYISFGRDCRELTDKFIESIRNREDLIIDSLSDNQIYDLCLSGKRIYEGRNGTSYINDRLLMPVSIFLKDDKLKDTYVDLTYNLKDLWFDGIRDFFRNCTINSSSDVELNNFYVGSIIITNVKYINANHDVLSFINDGLLATFHNNSSGMDISTIYIG